MADKPTVDGFYPRRPNNQGGVFDNGEIGFNSRGDNGRMYGNQPQTLRQNTMQKNSDYHMPGVVTRDESTAPTPAAGLHQSELEDSLRQIDADGAAITPQPSRHGRRRKKNTENLPPKKRKRTKRIILIMLLLIILAAGYFFVKSYLAGRAIFKGDMFGIVQQKPLAQDANGRTNILIFGTSEDDEGGNHPGAYLTDSIMLLSVNQTKKDAYMVGIPRDLWVKYGEGCDAGYEGKINALYQCKSSDGKDDAAGSEALKAKVQEVTGLSVQYYAHINYTVVRDAVDAVGGVDVTIPDYDPSTPGIFDPNFDWKCSHKCHMVDYKDGQVAHMDGEHALAFARARNAEGGYGLPDGNFDREKDQQLVLMALRQKALSAGTLSNPVAVNNLISAMGNNLRTNFQVNEVRTLMSLASDIKQDAIHSISLNKEGEMAVTTGMSNDGQSIVKPVSGTYDYSSISKYIRKQVNSEPYMLEDATVAVLNGSGVAGQGRVAATKLEDMGFTIGDIGNAPAGSYANREVYARDASSKPATRQKLQSLYGTVQVGLDKFNVSTDVDFVVIVGKAAVTDQTNTVDNQ